MCLPAFNIASSFIDAEVMPLIARSVSLLLVISPPALRSLMISTQPLRAKNKSDHQYCPTIHKAHDNNILNQRNCTSVQDIRKDWSKAGHMLAVEQTATATQ